VLVAISDNGPQMTSKATAAFMAGARIAQHFGRPSTPNDQAWVESFFGHLKCEFPHLEKTRDPGELEAELDRLRIHYNTVRLHEGIGSVTPDDEHHGRGAAIRAARRAGLGGLLVSVEQNNHEFGIGAWGRMLARAGFTIVPELSHPIEWECDCGCLIPLSVLQPAGDSFDKTLAAFLAWLRSNGHALRGGNLDLRPQDAAALSGLAGEPLVDLRYRYDGRDVMLRAAELAPFLVYETATLRQLAASSSLPHLVALVTGRLADLQQLGIAPELTGSLAAPLLAASQSQEMALP
jgi:hypothetical protein